VLVRTCFPRNGYIDIRPEMQSKGIVRLHGRMDLDGENEGIGIEMRGVGYFSWCVQ
jgi:hypothetical protein